MFRKKKSGKEIYEKNFYENNFEHSHKYTKKITRKRIAIFLCILMLTLPLSYNYFKKADANDQSGTNLGTGPAHITTSSATSSPNAPTLNGYGTLKGWGTEESPYEIWTKQDLIIFAEYVNAYNTRTKKAVNDTAGQHYRLMADIDLTNIPLTRIIGYIRRENPNNLTQITRNVAFKGTFDGNNYTISNVRVVVPEAVSTIQYSTGMFGSISGATIKNLRVENINANLFYKDYVGGLVGYATGENTIENCYIQGSINGGFSVGGLVGRLEDGASLTVDNCHVDLRMIGFGSVGGILGATMVGDKNTGSYLTIRNTTVDGSIALVTNERTYGENAGGLVGSIRDNGKNRGYTLTIEDSIVNAPIIARSQLGGLIGLLEANSSSFNTTISGVKTTGDITVPLKDADSDDDSAGGLIGFLKTEGPLKIDNAVTTGNVSGTFNVGGLIGFSGTGTAFNVVNAKESNNVTIINSSSTGNVTGSGYGIGGLVGLLEGGAGQAKIENSYATGNVSYQDDSANVVNPEFKGAFVGGLVGIAYSHTTIEDSYTTGTVTGKTGVGGLIGAAGRTVVVLKSKAEGTVNGTANLTESNLETINKKLGNSTPRELGVGGLIGSMDETTILNSHATATVNAPNVNNVGGLVGYLYKSNLGLDYAMGNVVGRNNVGGLVGKAVDGDNVSSNLVDVYARGNVTGKVGVGGLLGNGSPTSTTMRIETSYASGVVTGNDAVGGIVGAYSGNVSIICSFFDKEVNEKSHLTPIDSINEGYGLLTNQMQGTAAKDNMTTKEKEFGFTTDHNIWDVVTDPDDYPIFETKDDLPPVITGDTNARLEINLNDLKDGEKFDLKKFDPKKYLHIFKIFDDITAPEDLIFTIVDFNVKPEEVQVNTSPWKLTIQVQDKGPGWSEKVTFNEVYFIDDKAPTITKKDDVFEIIEITEGDAFDWSKYFIVEDDKTDPKDLVIRVIGLYPGTASPEPYKVQLQVVDGANQLTVRDFEVQVNPTNPITPPADTIAPLIMLSNPSPLVSQDSEGQSIPVIQHPKDEPFKLSTYFIIQDDRPFEELTIQPEIDPYPVDESEVSLKVTDKAQNSTTFKFLLRPTESTTSSSLTVTPPEGDKAPTVTKKDNNVEVIEITQGVPFKWWEYFEIKDENITIEKDKITKYNKDVITSEIQIDDNIVKHDGIVAYLSEGTEDLVIRVVGLYPGLASPDPYYAELQVVDSAQQTTIVPFKVKINPSDPTALPPLPTTTTDQAPLVILRDLTTSDIRHEQGKKFDLDDLNEYLIIQDDHTPNEDLDIDVKYTDEVGIQEVTVSVTDKPINVTDKAISDADKPKGKTTTLKFLVTITKPTEEQDNETTEINLIAKTQDTITIEKGTTFAVEEYVEVEPKPDNLYLAFNDPDVSTLGTYKVKVTATTKDGKSISNTVELTVKVVDSIQKVTDTAAESDQDDANVERTTSLTPDVTKSIWSAGSEFRQQSYWEQTGATVIEWWKLLIDDPLKSLGLITGINLDANFDGILDIWGVDPSTLENTATNATTDSKTNPNVNKTIGVSQGATPAYSQFSDLAVNAWYQKAIEYAIDNGLMTGYGNDLFGPNDKVTRAQFTQIVYNREGKPIVPGKSKFPDVLPNKWYNNAIVWGETQTMVKGYSNGNFGPDDHITREQLMTIFHRYAPYLGLPVEEADESTLLNYKDGEMVSGYAKPAMAWALKVGIIQGKGDGVLDPRADASRAEVAQMMVNFIVKVIEKN